MAYLEKEKVRDIILASPEVKQEAFSVKVQATPGDPYYFNL